MIYSDLDSSRLDIWPLRTAFNSRLFLNFFRSFILFSPLCSTIPVVEFVLDFLGHSYIVYSGVSLLWHTHFVTAASSFIYRIKHVSPTPFSPDPTCPHPNASHPRLCLRHHRPIYPI